ncbi:MAG: lysine--tRNA ligase, partial [Deltaproteobacteria bacterium]|nr:lysine--tRNA ligase [Deltaproteobacteria bacterium]
MEKAQDLREMGIDPYANDFKVDTRALDFIRLYHEQDKESLEGSEQRHALAGRVVAVNKMGKAAFIRLQDSSCDEIAPNGEPVGRIQIYLRRDELPEADFAQYKKLDIGDIIGVSGSPMKTRTGELTVQVKSFRLLTKSLRPLPEKWHGLTDVETRYRQRYLDLIAN